MVEHPCPKLYPQNYGPRSRRRGTFGRSGKYTPGFRPYRITLFLRHDLSGLDWKRYGFIGSYRAERENSDLAFEESWVEQPV